MKMRSLFTTCTFLLFLSSTFVFAQDEPATPEEGEDDKKKKEEFTFEIDEEAKPTIELNPGKIEEEPEKKKEKKRKKNVFYGVKTKKRFTKTISPF